MIFFQKTIFCFVLWVLGSPAATALTRPFPVGLPTCLEADFRELEKLYDATNGDAWASHTNWFTGNTMSSWQGITLTADNCDVQSISLQDNRLVGTIPNLNLPNLTNLDLGYNRLTGTIPNFNFPKLRSLLLNNNELTGTIHNFNFPVLQSLTLSHNLLTGTIPNFNFPNLQVLLLYDNLLTGTIPNFNFPNLYSLLLYNNKLTGTIPNFNFPNLRSLAVSYNQLTGTIPNFNFPNLEGLWLNTNQFSGTIPNFNFPNLHTLSLNNNRLRDIIPNFNLPILQNLWLHNNQLTGTIPNFNLPNLNALNLASNQLTGTIPNFNNAPLRYLSLSNNQLTGNIPNLNISNLVNLSLDNNLFKFGDIEHKNWLTNPATSNLKYAPQNTLLPITNTAGILTGDLAGSTLPQLTYKWYKNGILVATTVGNNQYIPSEAGTYTYTVSHATITQTNNADRNLILSSKSVVITTPIITHALPAGLSACLYDDFIELEKFYNKTNGDSWYSHLNWFTSNDLSNWQGITLTTDKCDVQGIQLEANHLVGTIPNFKLPNLQSLVLINNQLTGSIPNFNLPNLAILALQNNQLIGTIPNFNLPNLTGVGLDNNQLTGSIPNFNLPNLKGLWLAGNRLTGAIPNFNLPNLQNLILSNNQLSGTIPNFNLPKAQVLGLNNNQLSGAIPNFNLPNLQNLILSYNQLSGAIPNFNLARLTQIELNNNLFKFGDMEGKPWLNLSRYAPQNTLLPISYSNRGILTADLAGSTLGKLTFNWYLNGVLVASSMRTNSYTPQAIGTYTYTVSHRDITQAHPDRNLILQSKSIVVNTLVLDSNPSDTPPQLKPIAVGTTVHPTLSEIHVIIAPNPTTDRVTIDYQGFTPKKIQIYNAVGDLQQVVPPVSDQFILDMSPYGNGIYFVQLDEKVFKIVKQ